MERKIGEIFEYNDEWYQCMKGNTCNDCAFYRSSCGSLTGKGSCRHDFRGDATNVIFKKLEKVGEPYEKRVSDGTFSKFQRYRVYNSVILPKEPYIYCNFIDGTVEIEIKQTKEDMEENKLNLKPFDIQKAREGKPVCTRDGRKARIICFDRISGDDYYKIVACVTVFDGDFEEVLFYGINGYIVDSQNPKDEDLMMLPEKKEGWVNIYRDCEGMNITRDDNIYSSKEAAIASAQIIDGNNYIATSKVEWEE